MNIKYSFRMGQIVYLKTDNEQLARMITGFTVRPTGIAYLLTVGTTETAHYDIEISDTRDIIKATSN